MRFKDMLLVLTSYPEPTPAGSVDQAVAFAAALGTRLSALSFAVDLKVPVGGSFLANTLLNLQGIIAAEKQRAAAITTARPIEQLAAHLLLHSVKVELDNVDAEGRPIGEVLEDYISSKGVHVLVMGAYGHSRIRDFVLGGATKSMLRRPPVPLFLSH
jgi:nucleotide-binding universal stress UspA family protein